MNIIGNVSYGTSHLHPITQTPETLNRLSEGIRGDFVNRRLAFGKLFFCRFFALLNEGNEFSAMRDIFPASGNQKMM